MKQLINIYKYNSVRAVARILAEMIETKIGKTNGVLVPLPTIQKHIRERGFDHIELIARKTGMKCEKILVRKNKSVQVGASAEQRKMQAESAYAVRGEINTEKNYILFDDV